MTTEELKNFMQELGEKPFRGKQLFKWVNRGITDFEEMTDFSKALRAKLSSAAYVGSLKTLNAQKDIKAGTRKFLFGLEDGNAIESVFMQYKYGNSLCVSSQVGCKMGCRFCATALDGFTRNLTAGEMLEQIYAAERETGKEINHIVVMGMGEPFMNYDETMRALKLINAGKGPNLGARHITISTCGVVPGFARLAAEGIQFELSVSLHAPNDELRSQLMPVNRRWPMEELLEACAAYTKSTKRIITFEYTVIKGVV